MKRSRVKKMRKIDEFQDVCSGLSLPFSTNDVIEKLKHDHPSVWDGEFLSRHKEGGRGCGVHFSASSLVACQLPKYGFARVKRWGNSHEIAENWGSGYIAMWDRK